MDLTETAAVVSRSVVALGSLAVPTRFRFGPNDGIPPIIGTGFVVDPQGVVMTAGHVARALRALPKHPVTGKHAAVAILFTEPARVGDGLEMKPVWIEVKGYSIDAISHGGASGSPIFRRDDPAVLLYAAFEGQGIT